jgi:outer membrane protein assembly factor BamB
MSKLISVAGLRMALALTLSLLTLAGCADTPETGSVPSATPTPVPGSYPSSNGAMARGNIQGTGVYDTRPLVQLPTEAWRFQTNHPSDPNSVPASVPAIFSDTVYFGTYDDTMYVLDTTTGSMRWHCYMCQDGMRSPSVANGLIYVPSMNERLYAFDSMTGASRWTFSIRDTSKLFATFSDPVVNGGIVYVGCTRDSFFALDGTTGKVKWRFDASGWISAPAIANGTLYFGGRRVGGDKQLFIYAVDQATGKEKWRVPMTQNGLKDSPGGLQDTPAVADGVVYAATWNDGLLALDAATGQKKWQYAAGSTILDAPAVAYGNVYVAANGSLVALDATTGQEKWSVGDGNRDFTTTAPFIAGHVAYFTSTGYSSLPFLFVAQPDKGGYIYAVDADTGKQLWSYKVDSRILYSPAIFEGAIYYGDEDGYLHALR